MAITKIRAIKVKLTMALNYIMNDKKTDGKILVSGLHCAPEVADIEFKMTKEFYGKEDGKLAYHLIQSFKPGEVKVEQAHEIGFKLAQQVCQNKYQAVISTHIDKGHIHNHIIFNSVSHETGEKYNDCKKSYNEIRKINDSLCQEANLTVIREPKEKGKKYKEWQEIQKGTSWKEFIRKDIDEAIKNSKSYEDFLNKMKEKSYSIKQGKYISFRPHDKERFVRGKTLGFDYREDMIKSRISMKALGFPIETYARGTKVYRAKKNTFMKVRFKRRSLLEINVMLAIAIVKALARKKKLTIRSKIAAKVDDSRVQILASQLQFIRAEKITGPRMLHELMADVHKQIEHTRQTMKDLDSNSKAMNLIHRSIISYKANKPYFDEVNASFFKKKKLESKYTLELKTYQYAKQKLEEAGVQSESDIDAFMTKYNEHKGNMDDVKKRYESLKKKEQRYIFLDETIREICDTKHVLNDRANKNNKKDIER